MASWNWFERVWERRVSIHEDLERAGAVAVAVAMDGGNGRLS